MNEKTYGGARRAQESSQSTAWSACAASSARTERKNVPDRDPRDDGRVGAAARGREPIGSQFIIAGRTVVVADPEMIRIYGLIDRLARTHLPIVIRGESGVGKEHAALAVHAWSARAAAPLLALNCAALQDGLVEGELFGYERGAFSGAIASKPGLIERADGGTLFLDEVNELSAAAQAKLLRVLESKQMTRLGGTRERAIDIRIVSATNGDLLGEIAAERFRRDLYFRLSGATVMLPPLRARPNEIPILAYHFLVAARARDDRDPVAISPAAMQCLLAHPWAGNIRELKHTMGYAAALLDGDLVEPWHLPEAVMKDPEAAPVPGPTPAVTPTPAVAPTPYPHGTDRHPERFRPVAEELRALECRRMSEALRVTGGVQRRAAQLIGMPVRTFTCKLTQYGLRGMHDRS
jgi:DNA-binding NtrC family response regulator